MPFNKHFNKELYEISQQDLEDFFSDEIQETSTLELKSGDVDVIKIYREICAFLNTEGGTLIIGAPEEVEKKINGTKQKVYSGELVPSNFRNKDWLTQKIGSYVVPAPIGINIREVPVDDGKVFIIQIPKSSISPHQDSTGGKYYIRMEGEAKPAPHGIVESLFNQVKSANLSVNIEVNRINQSLFKIIAVVSNKDLRPAEGITVFMAVVGNVLLENDDYQAQSILIDNNERVINKNTKLDISLVAGLASNVKLDIRVFGDEIKVLIGYWSKNTDAKFDAFIYNVNDEEITAHESSKDGEYKLIDEISKLATPNAN
jgi:hypothetical protein